MPTTDQLSEAPTASTLALVAGLIDRGLDDSESVAAVTMARGILDLIVGADGNPGPLDRYEVRADVMETTGKPILYWFCPRPHNGGPNGHVGIIARDMDGDQTGLTLGEMLQAVLEHEDEAHQ